MENTTEGTNQRETDKQQASDQDESQRPAPRKPTEKQLEYLKALLAKAHERGLPYLPIDTLSRSNVVAWIEFLQEFTEGGPTGPSPHFSEPVFLTRGGIAANGARMLPIVTFNGKHCFLDERLRELRNVEDPLDVSVLNDRELAYFLLLTPRNSPVREGSKGLPPGAGCDHAVECFFDSDGDDVLYCARCRSLL